jgi:NitT/TauT family transport system substrate-binding protein
MLKLMPAALLLLTLASGCTERREEKPVTLAISPWSGYEYLYLAQELGFFQKVGINVKIRELYSLSDSQRAFTQGRTDGMASSLAEVVQAAGMIDHQIHVALVVDYSDGADVIISQAKFTDLRALQGKKVAAEPGSLGVVLLSSALAYYDMDINDIEFVALDQSAIVAELRAGTIDAGVTFPPFSNQLNKDIGIKTIFTSAQIPGQIVDVVSFRGDLELSTEWIKKFHTAWQMALDYTELHPAEADGIMAGHEHISVTEFRVSRDNTNLVSADRQMHAMDLINQAGTIANTCRTLGRLKSIRENCQTLLERIKLRSVR